SSELLSSFADRHLDHDKVFARVEADVSQHGREDGIVAGDERGHGDGLALQITHRADSLGAEQFVTTDMHAGQDKDWITTIGPADNAARCGHVEVELAGGQRSE